MRAALVRTAVLAAAVTLSATACSEAPTNPASPKASTATASRLETGVGVRQWLAGALGPASPAAGAEILVGAGDIAECYHGRPSFPIEPPPSSSGTAAERTAALLDNIPGTVMAVGDNAYQFGLYDPDYKHCYDPTWGRHFDRTRPTPGNHEYMSGATGYQLYFRDRAGPPGLYYYSYNLGSWHIIVINSTPQVYLCYPPELTEIENEVESDPWWQTVMGWTPQLDREPTTRAAGRACAGDVAQQVWLVKDLTTHANFQCTAVYFHHPRFSSGSHGNHYQMQRIWDILYAYGADVVITGHDHNYERFAPQDEKGHYDPSFGIRQFVVGTGGADLRSVGPPIRNSEAIVPWVHGVLGLALNEGSYGWAFVGVDGMVKDSGSESCHGPPKKQRLPFTLPM